MSEEEQRIAIAEACGWKRSDLRPSWCHPDNWSMAKNGSYEVWVSRDKLPDYLNDLNAMHEAKETLNFHQQTDYVRNLMLQHKDFPMTDAFFATARQQAEAFLKTVGKWKE